MVVSIADIAKNIKEPDAILNQVIQDFLDGGFYSGPAITVGQWRIGNHRLLRKWAYPAIEEFIDAQLKIRDDRQEGQIQLDEYDAGCWTVKDRFPKE